MLRNWVQQLDSLSVDQKHSQHFGAFVESRTQEDSPWLKVEDVYDNLLKSLQAPKVLEGEPKVSRGVEEMDPEVM